MAYATAGELETYTGNAAPANATVLVYRASRKVDELLMCAVYDVDSGGLPTDPVLATAMREATCEQVKWGRAQRHPRVGGGGSARRCADRSRQAARWRESGQLEAPGMSGDLLA